MSAPANAVDAMLELVADQVATRVLAELEDRSPATADEPWRLLTLEDAAARLGRSTRWLRDRVKRGDLPYVRLDGGAFAFELDDLRAFALERRIACTPLAGTPETEQSSGNGTARLSRSQKATQGRSE